MDRNEDIHLWLLEEDRKKRQAHISELNGQYPASQNQTIAYHPFFEQRTVSNGENRQLTLKILDLEKLLREKVELEVELHRLDDQQRVLDERAKFLCGRIIQEMRKQNREKKQAVCDLRERIAELETRLGQFDGGVDLAVQS